MALIIELTLRMSFTALMAFVLMRFRPFRRLLAGTGHPRDSWLLSVIFGLIAVSGTYTGVPINGAIANSRVIGAAVGGLLGGPWVGFGAGLISGVHRYFLGGFTALSCSLSTLVEGILAGWIHKLAGQRRLNWQVGLLTGLVAEVLQMGIILTLTRPLDQAIELVRVIAIPMTLVNAGGVALFVLIIKDALAAEEQIASFHTHKVLEIAQATLPYLRRGLDQESAKQVAHIIYAKMEAAAVALTDRTHVLAHVGVGSDHHRAGAPIATEGTLHVLSDGQVRLAATREAIGCKHPGCPLSSGLIMPLFVRGQLVGTLKIYRHKEYSMTPHFIELATGMAALFSTQLELAELERQAQMATRAELKALRAQINPHFLFNALNTITSFIRTDPEQARTLLGHLSDFFRRTLRSGEELVPLAQELELVDRYLAIERARFGDRLKVSVDMDPAIMHQLIPSFALQPLVENAVKHGLMPRRSGGTVLIKGEMKGETITLTVADDGQGMDPQVAAAALAGRAINTSSGIGLMNVNERLKGHFGPDAALQIATAPGAGTSITIRLPAFTAANRRRRVKKEA